MQCCAHYTKMLDAKAIVTCPIPCFFLEIFGPNVAVSGAVFSDFVCVDKFTTMSLLFQPNDLHAMAQLARTFKALKVALHQMKRYYENMPVDEESKQQVQFPVFRSFNDCNTIVYKKKINDNVFCGVTNDGQNVIVKFAYEYGKEAHDLCSHNGFAPHLLSTNKVTSWYLMVVMEEVNDATPLRWFYGEHPELKELLKERCRLVLKLLHNNNLCHGDFRDCNILVVPCSRSSFGYDIAVIDFDWSGKAGIATYPFFMNRSEIKWHETASNGMPLCFEHDLHWLDYNFRPAVESDLRYIM